MQLQFVVVVQLHCQSCSVAASIDAIATEKTELLKDLVHLHGPPLQCHLLN